MIRLIKLAMTCAKLGLLSVIVLVLAQLTVSNRRVADHVWDMTHHPRVQAPIQWIASKVNFIEGHKITTADGKTNAGHAEKHNLSRAAGSDYSAPDRQRLSGLLKR